MWRAPRGRRTASLLLFGLLGWTWGCSSFVQGDTVFVRPAVGLHERRQIRLAPGEAPLAFAVADTERLDAYRYSPGRTALLVATTFGVVLFAALTVCVMCDFGGGDTYFP